ncbi:hypothetical protein D3C81_922850 [compost metagenome]
MHGLSRHSEAACAPSLSHSEGEGWGGVALLTVRRASKNTQPRAAPPGPPKRAMKEISKQQKSGPKAAFFRINHQTPTTQPFTASGDAGAAAVPAGTIPFNSRYRARVSAISTSSVRRCCSKAVCRRSCANSSL